jgi:hypothetical protein
VIDRIVAVIGRNRAGAYTGESILAVETLEVDELEVLPRSLVGCPDVLSGIAVGNPDSGKGPFPGGAEEGGEAAAVGDVIEKVVAADGFEQRNEVAACQQRDFAPLVEVKPLCKDGESDRDRTVQKVGLGKSESGIADAVAKLHVQAQRFAEA